MKETKGGFTFTAKYPSAMPMGKSGVFGRFGGSLPPIRTALKAAGGRWDEDRDGEGTQLRFSAGTPDCRWAGYCLKNVHKATPERRRFMRQYGSPRLWVAGFEGKSVTASEGLKRTARTLHSMATRA